MFSNFLKSHIEFSAIFLQPLVEGKIFRKIKIFFGKHFQKQHRPVLTLGTSTVVKEAPSEELMLAYRKVIALLDSIEWDSPYAHISDELEEIGKLSGHSHVRVDIYFTGAGLVDIPTEQEILRLMNEIRNNETVTQFAQ